MKKIANTTRKVYKTAHHIHDIQTQTTGKETHCMTDNIQDIIDKLLEDDNQRAKQLFVDGETTGFVSLSDAELELCKMIATYTEDAKKIEAVFKESALYRPRIWDHNSHGNTVINKALILCSTERPVPSFVIRNVINGRDVHEYINEPLLTAWVRKNIEYRFVKDSVTRSLSVYLYEDGVYREIDELYLQGLIKKAIEDYNPLLVKSSIIESTYNVLLKDLNHLKNGQFNADENIINFRNGILHLNTMELKPHSPEYLTTIQIPCDWCDDKTDTPIFDAYLQTLTNGDEGVKKFLLQFIGAVLSNIQGWRMKKALVLVGEGNTGKTQIRRLVELLLGADNYTTIDLPDLEDPYGPGDLLHKRLGGCADMKFASLKSLKYFKLLTGGDSIRAQRKYRDAVSMVYRGLLWYCTNELPRFGGDKGKWVYDRFCIINCNNVIPEKDQDCHLLDKMYAERQGIIIKAIFALRELIKNNFKFAEPQAMIDARLAYSKDNNVVGRFFKECMLLDVTLPNYKCPPITDIYSTFCSWCINNNNSHRIEFKLFKQEAAKYLDIDVNNLLVRTSNGDVICGYTFSEIAKMYKK